MPQRRWNRELLCPALLTLPTSDGVITRSCSYGPVRECERANQNGDTTRSMIAGD
jgi:hypothetical protein